MRTRTKMLHLLILLSSVTGLLFLQGCAACSRGAGVDSKVQSLLSIDDGGSQAPAPAANSAPAPVAPVVVPAPKTPSVSIPATSPYISNSSTLTISGACETGATVVLSGSESATTACSSGSYSFVVNRASDGSYSFGISQANSGGGSPAVLQDWVRDTIAPVVVVSVPAANPLVSGDSSISLEGQCESGSNVLLSGAGSAAAPCVSSAFSFALSKSVDATYSYTLSQTDSAGNTGSVTFEWVRDTTIPPTPVISSPSSTPFYSNAGTLVVSGSCISGNLVYLEGSNTATVTCDTLNSFSFSVAQTDDGSYSLFLSQENSATGGVSSQAALTWVKDTSVPIAPALLNPNVNPYVSSGTLLVQGICEPRSSVLLAGSSSQSVVCSSASTFSMSVSPGADGVYNYTLSQSDLAGNSSGTTAFQWTRNSALPPTPTIAVPAVNPYLFNGNSVTLSGQCSDGMLVSLSGSVSASDVTAPAGSLTQSCASAAYSFTLSKSVDGNYDFSIKQNNGSADSGSIGARWVRDVAPPLLTLSKAPLNPNYSLYAAFEFSANEPATFECRVNGGTWLACASPKVLSGLSNGAQLMEIRGRDAAGNMSDVTSYAWTQDAHATVALFHLDDSAPLADSGLYGVNSNSFSTSAGVSSVAGKFGEARSFAGAGLLSAPDSASLSAVGSKLTVEAWVKIGSVPNSGYSVLFGQHAAAAGNHGWELRFRKGPAGKVRFNFYSSTGASTGSEVVSSSVVWSAATYYHVAVTYNAGAIRIYFNGKQIGSGTQVSTSLNNSGTLFRVGQDASGNARMDATIDEIRVSQSIRYSAPFTTAVPSGAFVAD